MALIPILFRKWIDDCLDERLRPAQFLNKRFGSDLYTEEILLALDKFPRRCRRKRCWRQSESCNEVEQDEVIAKQPTGEFQVTVDFEQFKPEEISVKATDKCITVEGRHEENDGEAGYVLRHFVQCYQLPERHDNSKISSTLSSDGVLTISAPKLALPEPEKERTISVKHVEKPKEVPEQSKEDKSVTLEDLED